MIIIHHGSNGSYKTSGAIQYYLIDALKAGRYVYTNIRGLKSVREIEKVLDFKFPESAKIENCGMDSAEDFDNAATFFHRVPNGAMMIMDEAQAIFHKSRKIAEWNYKGTDPTRFGTLEKAFEMQRHRNWDIVLTTPNISKLRPEIRQSAARAFLHISLHGKLPWMKNLYTEIEHDPETSGKSKSHAIGTPRRVKLDVKTFDLYESTSTGVAKSDQAATPILKDPRVRFLGVVVVLALSSVVYSVYNRVVDEEIVQPDALDSPSNLADTKKVPSVLRGDNGVEFLSPNGITNRPNVAKNTVYLGASVVITGTMGSVTFLDIDGVGVTSDQLRKRGFSLLRRNECVGVINGPNTVSRKIYCI